MENVVTQFRDRKMEFQRVADGFDLPMVPQRLKKEMDIVVIDKKNGVDLGILLCEDKKMNLWSTACSWRSYLA
jgi:hypothetical protein